MWLSVILTAVGGLREGLVADGRFLWFGRRA